MNHPRISAIAAIGKTSRALGKNNALLWRIPDDLKHFKALTEGHTVVMGRKTFESIGKPLPRRTNIVVSRSPDFKAPGCLIVDSIEAALARAKESEPTEVFIIGGGEIFRQAMPVTDRLYLTLVDSDEAGDVFFPEYPEFSKIIDSEKRKSGNLSYEFLTLER